MGAPNSGLIEPAGANGPTQSGLLRRGGSFLSGVERRLVSAALSRLGNPDLALTTWDGQSIGPDDATYRLTVTSRRALLRTALDPDRYFGEEYASGRIRVSGDLCGFLEHVMTRRESRGRDGLLDRPLQRARRARNNSRAGSRENIRHHYDIGNEFYSRWLDRDMVYTCAYFESPDAGLEEAQRAKLDLICRKLRLRPGQTVIEAGCGWGALARHMARHYGVTVRAFNISTAQVAWAREQASRDGLSDRVEFVLDDYRAVTGQYDAFVSVGMLEHVGVEHYETLGRVIDRCLAPNGLGLIHSIGQNLGRPMNSWIERNIFPGAYPPTLAEITGILRPYNFTVLDVENLRLHYARTLEHWLDRYEEHFTTVAHQFDASFARAWRFYLAGSLATFLTGRLQLFQVLFSRHHNNDVPWSRNHLLANSETVG